MRNLEGERTELEAVIDLMPYSVSIIDGQLTVRHANKFFFDIVGAIHNESVKQAIGDYICCENSFLSPKGCGHSVKCKWCELRKVIVDTLKTWEPSEIVEVNFTILKQNKYESKWYKINTIPTMKNDEKQIIFGMVEITDYKNLNAKMIKLKEEAETANRAKSEFLANMSHEIRTPLNGIVGMTDLTLLTDVTEEQTENLTILKDCADQLLSLINNILDLSKIEAGRVGIEQCEFDVKKLLSKLIGIHSVKAKEKNIDLKYYLDDKVPKMLIGDAYRLGQVLSNLISNAVKFTNCGEVIVKVNRINNINEVYDIEFIVEDTGIGISEEESKCIFKRFSQVDGSITREYGGSGLGLVISQKLINLMGGNIEFDSKKGEGSKFYFNIKLQKTNKILLETIINVKKNKDLVTLNILLVEDNKINQVVTKRLLNEMGYTRIMIASNGIEALKLFDNNRFDIILMDLQMPELGGVETAQIIREKEKKTGNHVKIVALTACALKGDRETFLSKGMDGYIVKPVGMKEFSETLNEVSEKIFSKESSTVKEYLKIISDENNQDSEEINEEMHKYLIDNLKKLYLHVKEVRKKNINYFEVERLAHNIKLKAEENQLKGIKKLSFKMELAARKKDEISMGKIFNEIYEILNNEI